jgi:hypothetical protein
VFQTNVVPQSGISRLSSRKANAVSSIGTNPRTSAAGASFPTTMTTKPRETAMLYAGATDERPSVTDDAKPIDRARSPLPLNSGPGCEASGTLSGTT